MSKSKAMCLGSKWFSAEKPFDIEWPDTPIKALGVYFSYKDDAAENMNCEPKIKILKTTLNKSLDV